MSKDTTVMKDELYPYVAEYLSKPANVNKFKACIARFMNDRSESLHDTAPVNRIFYKGEDIEMLFGAMGLKENDVYVLLKKTYYGSMEAFRPIAAKDATTCLLLCIIRYFTLAKDEKNLELALIYTSFSGKFYPSIHYSSFPIVPEKYRYVMEYVINSKLTDKYDLKREKTIFKTVRSIALTMHKAYPDRWEDFTDEDVVYIIQQLHTRISSFMKNIATLFYEAYENREGITYDSDNLEDGAKFRMVDNDSLKLDRLTEKSVNHITTTNTDYRICKYMADSNIKPEEIMGIIDAIVSDKVNIKAIKDLCSYIIADYMTNGKSKECKDIAFLAHSLAVKPNTKNPLVLGQREIIEEWLDENSPNYRRRKSRVATKNSYYKAILGYFVFVINQCAK